MARLLGMLFILGAGLFGIVAAFMSVFSKNAGRSRHGIDTDRGGDMSSKPLTERDLEEARRRMANARFEETQRKLRAEEKARRKRRGGIRAGWITAGVGAGLAVFGVVLSFDNANPLVGIGLGIMTGALFGWIGGLMADRAVRADEARRVLQVPTLPQLEIKAPTVAGDALPSGRTELVQKILGEAADALKALDAVRGRLRSPDSVASVAGIVATGNRIMTAVAAAPEGFATAQRLFTYYLPEAVKVGEALAALETDPRANAERIAATEGVMRKLAVLFDRTELELRETDGQSLDIDLRLLDQSLAADLKER